MKFCPERDASARTVLTIRMAVLRWTSFAARFFIASLFSEVAQHPRIERRMKRCAYWSLIDSLVQGTVCYYCCICAAEKNRFIYE